MDWKGRKTSTNVEDQRGRSVKGIVGGGIGNWVHILIVIAVLLLILKLLGVI